MIILTDIHGCYDTLMALLAKIPQEEKDKGIVFCGDLIDRGPKSAQIVEFVKSNNYPCVLGNHEDMMIQEGAMCLKYYQRGQMNTAFYSSGWVPNGGNKTLYSYETHLEDQLDDRGLPTEVFDLTLYEEHTEWMKQLPIIIEFPKVVNDKGEKLVISHSSIGHAFYKRNFTPNVDADQKQDIIWGRHHVPKKVKGKFNVFGHTPTPKPIIRDHFANIDTGCYLDGHYNMKYLTALSFPSMKVYQQECLDMNTIKPKTVFEDEE